MKQWIAVGLAFLMCIICSAALAFPESGEEPWTRIHPYDSLFGEHGVYDKTCIEAFEDVETQNGKFNITIYDVISEGKRRMRISFYDERKQVNGACPYMEWFTTDEALPQEVGYQVSVESGINEFTVKFGYKQGQTVASETFAWVTHEERIPGNEWSDCGFELTAYQAENGESVLVESSPQLAFSTLKFSDESGKKIGEQAVSLVNDLRWISFNELPKTLAYAQQNRDVPPGYSYRSSWKTFAAETTYLTKGHSRKVYLGPGSEYPRAGNGKAAVGTDSWVQVFGRCNGYLMILYHIDGKQYRIGWIDDSALKPDAQVAELELTGVEEIIFCEDGRNGCSLTDDPLGEMEEIAFLPEGTVVRQYGMLGVEWELVSVEIDGKTIFGFVPSGSISHG